MLGSLGFSPAECGYRIISSGPHWRLRKYGQTEGEAPLLVVSAPIKRPYIWDLAPPISFVRFCLEHHFGVYLIEWLAAREKDDKLALRTMQITFPNASLSFRGSRNE